MSKKIEVPEHVLEQMLAQWEPPETVEYRFATCWGCGRKLRFGMYHVFFRKQQREAHLCKDCGSLWEVT